MLFSCKSDEVSLPTLLVTPSQLQSVVTPNQVISFAINVEAEGGLSSFEITESINGATHTVIYDTIFGDTKNENLVYLYQMPNKREQLEVVLSFKVTDLLNNIGTAARKLKIEASDTLLTETKNIVLYSGNSNGKNAYFIDLDTTFNSDSTAYNDIDIFSPDTSDFLERRWISPKGNNFVKFNSFNYDSASFKSITEAYQFGNEANFVSNLSIGDIIIAKLSSPIQYEYILLKITNIVDDTGSTLDRYVFNIKK